MNKQELIKAFSGAVIKVDKMKRSITIDGREYKADCRAYAKDNEDGTGTITLIFDGKVIK